MPNYFELLKMPMSPDIDLKALRSSWQQQQKEKHPDRSSDEQESDAVTLNQAYQTLKDPLTRVAHLLACYDQMPTDREQRQLPVEFLEKQLYWQQLIHSQNIHQHPAEQEQIFATKKEIQTNLFKAILAQDWKTARCLYPLWCFLVKTVKMVDDLLDQS